MDSLSRIDVTKHTNPEGSELVMRRSLRVGIVGLPNAWRETYRPALEALGSRVSITAVFDPVFQLAVSEAEGLEASAVAGVLQLANRDDVDAIVVANPGWLGPKVLPHLAVTGKPVFLGLQVGQLEQIEYLHSVVTLNRCIWVPELSHRFAPATLRLMELIATRLGPPKRIEVLLSPEENTWSRFALARVIDWAFFVLQTAVRVQSVRIEQGGCRIRFAASKDTTVDLNIMNLRDSESPCRIVKCNRGQVVLHDEESISWRLTGHAECDEALTTERSAISQQLSVFLRRAAGGLIPTADLSDLHRAHVAADSISNAWF